ncbi:MAG: hypothetical protein QOG64_1066 [Acidimicrobiaceae bacterium]|nr:hypothetical protein [Acidimicrobiaceae bacterium]
MSFPSKLLNDGEEVVLDLRPHWLQLFWPAAAVVVTTALAIAVAVMNWDAPVLQYASFALVVVALIWLLLRYAKWTTTSFVVTSHRLVYRHGVLSKQGREIPLDRLNDISFQQSIFERMIGAGDLMIESAGEHGQSTFSDVRKPSKVQNEIYRQIEAGKDRDAGRMSGGRNHELSVPEQLDKLDELRQRGVISQAEFDAKKAQLLERM